MRTLLLVFALVAISAFPFISNWYYGSLRDSRESSQIEKVVEEYIAKNPEKILESVNRYHLAQLEEQQKQKAKEMSVLVSRNGKEIFDTHYPSFPAEKESVVVVEFFDASCGYCKLASQTLLKLKRDYSNVTYILRNLPILGQNSLLAAKYDVGTFLFTKEKGIEGSSYSTFHSKLMSHEGAYTPEVLNEIAVASALDPKEVAEFIRKNETRISDMIEATVKLAQKLRLEGTPAFIVGDQLVQGSDEMVLREAIENALKQ